MSSKTYYQPSLAGSIPGLVPALFVGFFGAFVLGLSYPAFMFWCPIRRIIILGVICFPLGMGFVSRAAVSVGKIQSPELAALVGMLNGFMAVYFSWVAYLQMATYSPATANVLVLNLNDMLTKIRELAEGGGRGFGESVSYGIWAVEACVAIAASTWMATPQTHPFCGKCRKWCKEWPCTPTFELPEDYEGMKSSLEQGDLTPLFTSARYAISNEPGLHATLYCCPGCEQSTWLKVEIVELLGIEGDKLKSRTHPLFDYVAIPRDQALRLLDPPYRQEPLMST